MRRIILILLVAVVALVALGSAVVAGGGGSSITRPRLERTLPVVFANLYADQARVLARPGITPASLGARAMCDKRGPDVPDVGPGGDWVCLMSWSDPIVPMPPEGYGKFELNVHSNGCFTASGPSKIIGFITITDPRGTVVPNPVFEFDGCFDPQGDNTPTGVLFAPLLTITSTTLSPDAQGRANIQVSCGPGSGNCSGSLKLLTDTSTLATMPYDLEEQATATLTVPVPVPAGVGQVTFEVQPTNGVGPTKPVVLPVQAP